MSDTPTPKPELPETVQAALGYMQSVIQTIEDRGSVRSDQLCEVALINLATSLSHIADALNLLSEDNAGLEADLAFVEGFDYAPREWGDDDDDDEEDEEDESTNVQATLDALRDELS